MSAEALGGVAFAASAGLATFFAPCAFPLLPGYVGYYVQRNGGGASGVGVWSAAAAAVGSVTSLGVIAVLVIAFGRRLTSVLPLLEPVVGIGLIAFGLLVLTGRAPTVSLPLPQRPESVMGFCVFGAVYALAAAGCVVPLFIGVLTQAATLPLRWGAATAIVYVSTATAPLVGVTLLAGAGIESWRGLGRYVGYMEYAAAVMMIAAGVGQVYLSVFVLDVL